jgi:hypothetical protein
MEAEAAIDALKRDLPGLKGVIKINDPNHYRKRIVEF